MIQVQDIPFIRGKFSIGQKIRCDRFTGGDRTQKVDATIVGKFPNFCLLEYEGQKLCVQWIDLAIQGAK